MQPERLHLFYELAIRADNRSGPLRRGDLGCNIWLRKFAACNVSNNWATPQQTKEASARTDLELERLNDYCHRNQKSRKKSVL